MKTRLIALCCIALGAALAPRAAFAACGIQDPGGCVDAATYSLWYGLAGLGWSLDRTLLLLAYQLEALRWWLVEVAFSSAYQALVQVIDPLILPVATTAVILGGLALLLLPLFGRTSMVSLRHALLWTVLAPLVVTVSGPLIVQLEQLRGGVSTALFAGVSQLAPGAIFGAAGSDMADAAPLYPSNPCGGGALTRRGDGMRLDDLAAALLWADAEDIHCPDRGGPSPDVPDRFYEAAPGGPGYAIDQDVALMNAGNDRAQAVQSMQRGAVRTFLGLLPATLAVLDALVQLVFALCLIALWVGVPIGLVFVFFAPAEGLFGALFRRMLGVLQVSWSSSVLLGLIAACLFAAADLRNAAAYTGFAIGGIALTGYLLTVAVDTLKGCVRTLNETVSTATGLSITRPFELAGETTASLAGAGAALATGSAATAVTAAAALEQTGSRRYAAAAAIGRIRPVAQLGEVATAMGWLDDEEVTRGLYAGERSAHGSWRGTRLQLMADAKQRDADGRTFAERAEERRVDRQLVRAERPTIVEELSSVARAGRSAYAYIGSAQMASDMYDAGEWLPDRTRAGWERVRQTWRGVGAAVDERGASHPIARGVTVAQVLDERLRPGGPGTTVALDERRRVRYGRQPEALPETALSAPRDEVRVARLLVHGYTVLDRGDGTLAFWKNTSAGSGAPSERAAPEDERKRLVQAGALLTAAAQARTARPTAGAQPAQQTAQRRAPDTPDQTAAVGGPTGPQPENGRAEETEETDA